MTTGISGITIRKLFRRHYFAAGLVISVSFCSFPVKSELKITTGKIIHREIYSGGFGSKKRYHITLKYIYSVNGKEYLSDRIWYFRIFYETPESAEKSIASYKLNEAVTVYYRPENPAESYLEADDE